MIISKAAYFEIQEMIDGHFKFYKQVNDDPDFSKFLLDWLFERYLTNMARRPLMLERSAQSNEENRDG